MFSWGVIAGRVPLWLFVSHAGDMFEGAADEKTVRMLFSMAFHTVWNTCCKPAVFSGDTVVVRDVSTRRNRTLKKTYEIDAAD